MSTKETLPEMSGALPYPVDDSTVPIDQTSASPAAPATVQGQEKLPSQDHVKEHETQEGELEKDDEAPHPMTNNENRGDTDGPSYRSRSRERDRASRSKERHRKHSPSNRDKKSKGRDSSHQGPPDRPSTLRPAELPSKDQQPSARRFDKFTRDVCRKVWAVDLGRMFNDVVEADRRGNISTALYLQLLAFFYCFVPMVVRAPYKDPVIATWKELEMYDMLMEIFGPGKRISDRRGRHERHVWYSSPEKSVWANLFGRLIGTNR